MVWLCRKKNLVLTATIRKSMNGMVYKQLLNFIAGNFDELQQIVAVNSSHLSVVSHFIGFLHVLG